MIAGFFGTLYTLWLYTGWLPYYLEHERHMTVEQVGVVAAIPYFFGCVGAVTGGWLCDFLTRRGWTPIRGRKLLISSALCANFVLHGGTILAQSNTAVLAFMFDFAVPMVAYCKVVYSAWATVPVAAPSQYTASLGLGSNFSGYLGGALATDCDRVHRAANGQLLAGAGDVERGAELTFRGQAFTLFLVREPIQAD